MISDMKNGIYSNPPKDIFMSNKCLISEAAAWQPRIK